ncbi:hypothetical protein D1007_21380 [Hordeum vulgare]|nr:hypothetical protein D1007_21380 [Hordeum vulgare]
MVKAARAGSLGSLLEEIPIWYILVRLPPKALLRCCTVFRARRSVTSTPDFLLAHHFHQVALPLADNGNKYTEDISKSLDRLQPIARLIAQSSFHMDATIGDDNIGNCISFFQPISSCDGLLIFCVEDTDFFICNPASRQYARLLLPMDRRWTVLGMYHHPLTGEYKILLYSYTGNMDDDELAPNSKFACHVLELASGKPLRRIVWPDAITITLLGLNPHVLFHGSLHWYPLDNDGNNTMIVVFNATSESFRQMRAPIVTYYADLFEIDDMLSMSAFDYVNTIDIWVLEDYEREVWVLNCRIELHAAEISVPYGVQLWLDVLVGPGDGQLVVLVKSHDWLLEVGMDGKLVATFHRKEVELTHFRLKQTLVPHTFFPTLKGYVVNSPPFI